MKKDEIFIKKVMIVVVILVIILLIYKGLTRRISTKIYLPKKQETVMYKGRKGESDIDTIWCGTFGLAWNELAEKIGHKVEFENHESDFVNKLNKQNFTKDMLSENDYYVKVDKLSPELKEEILKNINSKFGRDEKIILDRLNFKKDENKMTVYSVLKKEFNLIEKFYDLGVWSLRNANKKVRCFGIPAGGNSELYKNLEVMYCLEWTAGEPELTPLEKKYAYAIKINAEKDEEIIFVGIIDNAAESLNKIYEEITFLEQEYKGSKEFRDIDEFIAPHINLNAIIDYDELCEKKIKGTNGLALENAIQSINIFTNFDRDKVYKQRESNSDLMGGISKTSRSREFNFCQYYDSSYVFFKRVDQDEPYFSMKLNENFLETVN